MFTGIMQGRLSPRPPHRIQAFPCQTWQQEFDNARTIGLATIEWLFEVENYEQNPIWNEAGILGIQQRIAATGVQVSSVCADYFMPHPFFRVDEASRQHSITVLNRLIVQAAQLGVTTILLPVLEISEIRTDDEQALLLASLQEPLNLAQQHGIRIGLETELPVDKYFALVHAAPHPALGIYYDTGNCAAQGYDIAKDISTLQVDLCGVHVKDRKRGGGTMLLGEGDTDLAGFFRAIPDYNGLVILQTAFGEDVLDTVRRHLNMVRSWRGDAGAAQL